jgi:site-specific recombinase XerD
MSPMPSAPTFPSLLQDFFCQRLVAQRNASPRTIASYRDAFRLLLHYAEMRLHKPPFALTLADLDVPLVVGFLDHLEKERGSCARSRNARLAAIRSFLRYASFRDPASLPGIQCVMAIPMKRFDRPLIGFLDREEIEAILRAPDGSTWSGHRDHVMLTTLYNTGARASEITALQVADLSLERTASIRIRGKGRKERSVPLWRSTATEIRRWLPRVSQSSEAPVFPNRRGLPLSRSGIEDRLRAAVRIAAERVPRLKRRRISPHTLRHTTAMHLLQSGVDITVIALWLGHESVATTHLYLEADLAMKERALQKVQAPHVKSARYRPNDRALAFLDAL